MIWRLFSGHFVLCAFMGLLLAEMLMRVLGLWTRDGAIGITWFTIGCAVLNGVLLALVLIAYYTVRRRCTRKSVCLFQDPPVGRELAIVIVIAFCSGFLDMVLFNNSWGLLFLTVLVISMAIIHVRHFLKTVVRILAPGASVSWRQIGELLYVYLSIIAAFTLICATMVAMHVIVNDKQPVFCFATGDPRSVLDLLYFSIVVVTTLGFGDITPVSLDARIIVACMCLVSYVMFALMIGCVTQGVGRGVKEGNEEREAPEGRA